MIPMSAINQVLHVRALRATRRRASQVVLTAMLSVFVVSLASAQSQAATKKLTQCANPSSVQGALTLAETGTAAQRRLGQGVAMFDSNRYVLSMDHLKAALAIGLPDRTETAIANKYLGFYYCLHSAWKMCELHLERALTASPGFDLNSGEKANPAWKNTYAKVAQRVGDGCDKGVDTANATNSANNPKNGVPFTQAAVAEAESTAGKKSATQGTIELDVRPWGEVYIDSKQVAVSPPSKALSLKPGVHRVEVRNQGGTTLKTLVTVEAGDVTRLTHRF